MSPLVILCFGIPFGLHSDTTAPKDEVGKPHQKVEAASAESREPEQAIRRLIKAAETDTAFAEVIEDWYLFGAARATRDDEDRSPFHSAVANLKAMDGGQASVPGLVALLSVDDATKQMAAFYALAEIGPAARAAVPDIAKALHGGDEQVRTLAGITLSKIAPDGDACVSALVEAMQEDDHLAQVISTSMSPAVVPKLIEHLTDDDLRVQAVVAYLLGSFGPAAREANPALMKLLGHENQDIQMVAAMALYAIGPSEASVPVLIERLGSENDIVRGMAVASLAEIGPDAKAALPALEGLLKSDDDGRRVGVGEAIKKIRSEKRDTGLDLAYRDMLRGPVTEGNCAAAAHHGVEFAFGSVFNTVRRWDAANGAEVASLYVEFEDFGSLHSLDFSADDKFLAVVGGNSDRGTAKLIDVQSGKQMAEMQGHRAWVNAAAFAPDGKILATGSYDNTVKLWDVPSGRLRRSLPEFDNRVNSLAFSPDGSTLFVGAGSVHAWDLKAQKVLYALDGHMSAFGEPVSFLAISPDGKTLATVGGIGGVTLWSTQTRQLRATLDWDMLFGWALAFSPDGNVVAAAGAGTPYTPGKVVLWDAQSGAEHASVTGHITLVTSLAFSSDGKILATAGLDNTVKFWEVVRRKADE